VIVVAILTVRAAEVDAFERFEREAAAILVRHGARIARTVREAPLTGAAFREIHLLEFPDRAAFDAYRGDPALVALAPLRARAVVATELVLGEPGPAYEPG
jgi:uncharacterized protein (DUF1330 family)